MLRLFDSFPILIINHTSKFHSKKALGLIFPTETNADKNAEDEEK